MGWGSQEQFEILHALQRMDSETESTLNVTRKPNWHRELFSQGHYCPVPVPAAAKLTVPVPSNEGEEDEAILVVSAEKPDITFETIYFSSHSHVFSREGARRYAGFILYAWTDPHNGDVKDEWELNGIQCKSAYLVIQDTDSHSVKRYVKPAPGRVHGAVYWNVFGEGADVKMAVGEGFSIMNGELKWNSITFNANEDTYHDGQKKISNLAEKCVSKIINDWMEMDPIVEKTYSVKELLSD